MSCDNVITVQDLEADKKHSTFYREVITGKAGGTGADIDFATNAVTGQTQTTLPKVLSNVGFSPAGFDFTTGGTLTERDKAIFYQADGNWYSWGGALPKVVPPASSPASTGGIADNAWNVSTSAFMYRDWEGFTAELLAQAGIVDGGNPDELGASQRVDAIKRIVAVQTDYTFETVADMAAATQIKTGETITTRAFNTTCVCVWVAVASGAGDMTDGTTPISGGLFAKLVVEDDHTIAHYGATNDGDANDFDAMNAMHSNTGRIKLIYRGNHVLQGTLSFPAGTQRKDIDFNHAKVKIGTIVGDYLFIINGSATVQNYLNFIHSGQVDLNGAKGLVDWNSGSFNSGLRDIYIFDSTSSSAVVAVRSFNSFNMVFDNFRTSGSLGGTHLLIEADTGVSGFPNLTNIKLKDSILQTNQNNATLIKILLGASAADTISIENTALKSNVAATGSVSLDIDGFINSLEISNLHLETSNEVFRTAAGKTINANIHDCLITDCRTTFNWGASGWISGNNNRWVDGPGTIVGKEVFTLLNADFTQNGAFLVDTGNYDAEIKAGSGTFRREKDEVTTIVGNRNASRVDDSRIYVNKTAGSTINLPKSSEVKAGFKQGLMTRTGTNRFQCQDGDRILGVSGTTVDGGIQTGGTGNYAEVTCQNDDGGNKFWQVTSLVGTWVGY